MALKKSQQSLKKWTGQKWRTASGKKSSETGEVYAPASKIKRLKSTKAGRAKLAAANRKKRAATKKGKQYAKHGLHKRKRS
jgi:predicted component of type VI protein secretion system